MEATHERIDDDPPNTDHMICLATDLTGNGRDDVIVGARHGAPSIYWYENPGWECHEIVEVPGLEAGGAFADITGNGRLDIIAGGHLGQYKAYWFEQPADPREPWSVHTFCEDYHKYHDQAFADVDDDGAPEVLLLSQNSEVMCYYDVPADPRETPWPREQRTIIDAGEGDTEGIHVGDLDHDGRTELVLGRHLYHRADGAGKEWEFERIAPGWEEERVRVQVADLDDDGAYEIVVAECELPALGGRHGIHHDARLGICRGPDWEPHILRDDLHCPHSLQVADFSGDGTWDIYVAESDYGGNEHPRQFVYTNQGDGTYTEHLVFEGIGTHQAQVADLDGNGQPGIVGKNDTDPSHVDAWRLTS